MGNCARLKAAASVDCGKRFAGWRAGADRGAAQISRVDFGRDRRSGDHRRDFVGRFVFHAHLGRAASHSRLHQAPAQFKLHQLQRGGRRICGFAGRSSRGLHRDNARRQIPALDSFTRFLAGAGAGRHGRSESALLVSGQPLYWILCGGEAEKNRGVRRTAVCDLRCTGR